MRMSTLLVRTLRDDPADAEVESHRLLVRGGCIRRVASGMYAWLPLGRRVLHRVEAIVREEMDAAGAQEVVLPITQPLELWQRSGRDGAYGPLMFRLQDRKETWFCLSPTAEELITTVVAAEYSSYRDLPLSLYQVNWKYRDELRPRFGLLRGREFLMKDAYSFDLDGAGLAESYRAMYDAYGRVFDRCGLRFRAVEGESGEMGGDVNHEFMAIAAVGEDAFVWCPACDYAANLEVARRASPGVPGDRAQADDALARPGGDAGGDAGAPEPREELLTPDLPGITAVAEHLGIEPGGMLKCLVFEVDGEIGLALVPGDRELNEIALARALAPRRVQLFDDDDFAAHPEVPRGYVGPDLPAAAIVVADPSVRDRGGWVTGANRADHHVRGACLGRDFRVDVWSDLVTVVSGDPCPRCGAPLSVDRGIEVGQVFQLGTKYATTFGALYTDETGSQHPMVMGCYGIGISRVVAAIVEQHHDDAGIVWPATVAPFAVHLIAMPGGVVERAADGLYDQLRAAGVEVLYDDRDARPGVKFADADLMGVPVQIVVGERGLARGVIERKTRATGERDEISLDDALGVLRPS